MKKISTIILIAFFVGGCGDQKMNKPFVIVFKSQDIGDSWFYRYQDSSGRRERFWDKKIYNIGDTIK